jgi:polysaccharide deacetylase family protein (PEP-CTERM system associated)
MVDHALTIDLEDWHQLLHRRVTGELISPSPAVVTATHRLLDLLDETGTRATFFVQGTVGDAYPELVRKVAARGHEVGSHTFMHNLVFRMDPPSFRADLDRSVKQLQDLTGQPVLGFRAPEFSVKGLDHWSFEVLAELGFQYDSSVFPISGARYGIPQASRFPFTISTPSGTIREYPLATWKVSRFRIPVAGGTYYRFLPSALLRHALAKLDANACTAVLYFHPYEFHQEWLYLNGLAWRHLQKAVNVKYCLLHNFCTGRIIQQVREFLTCFRFMPLAEIYRRNPLPRS